jgi:hypothetical protein
MAYTQEQLDALEKSIASGSRRVKYSDQEIEYRTLDEMRSLRLEMKKELGLVTKTNRYYLEFLRGFQ